MWNRRDNVTDALLQYLRTPKVLVERSEEQRADNGQGQGARAGTDDGADRSQARLPRSAVHLLTTTTIMPVPGLDVV